MLAAEVCGSDVKILAAVEGVTPVDMPNIPLPNPKLRLPVFVDVGALPSRPKLGVEVAVMGVFPKVKPLNPEDAVEATAVGPKEKPVTEVAGLNPKLLSP
uniref:Uncharacterized protein n=1 Tax=Arion vulgaris TaxID=1028688 RepID=A0A0B6ZHY6_9EUPU